jgi:protein ImuA
MFTLPLSISQNSPAGLGSGAVHELRAPDATAAHAAFAILLLAKLPGSTPILWVSPRNTAYPPGLAWLGLDPARLLFAQAGDDAQSFGTLEVALRDGMSGVAETTSLSRLAARRLALAAKTGGGIGFLLRHAPGFTAQDSTAFATRWMISPAPGGRLRAELLYARHGRPGVFFYEITEAHDGTAPPALALVSEPAEPARRARA